MCLIIQLVRLATSFLPVSHHSIKYPIIASSGSNFHMFSLKSMNFWTYYPFYWSRQFCTVRWRISDNILSIDNVRLFLHIKKPHQGLQSSFEDGIDIKFHFSIKAIVGSVDILFRCNPTWRQHSRRCCCGRRGWNGDGQIDNSRLATNSLSLSRILKTDSKHYYSKLLTLEVERIPRHPGGAGDRAETWQETKKEKSQQRNVQRT